MRPEIRVKTPSLGAGTELTVLASIKPGFVPSLDSVTYATRVKLLLKALHGGRRTLHEYQLLRAVSDAVERVGVIHTLRVAVLEPQNQVLLSVNFDGAYESYLRTIWQKTTRLLDLIFCNTVNYPTGWDHSLQVWGAWLGSVQAEIPFFYSRPGLTSQDSTGLPLHELIDRRQSDDLAITRLNIPSAERISWDIVLGRPDPSQPAPTAPQGGAAGPRAGVRQGLQSLLGLYRLADLYPPGTDDGLVLHRAARELLPEFTRLQTLDSYARATDLAAERFAYQEAVAWLRDEAERLPSVRVPPPLPQQMPAYPAHQVQGGIIEAYQNVSHGCLCLLALDSPAGAAALLQGLQVSLAGFKPPAGTPIFNIGFTANGLRACGLGEVQLGWLSEEFLQGMALRAGLLGDVHANHPRRWVLPLRNWPQGLDDPAWQAPAGTDPLRVPMEAVHAVLQVRWADAEKAEAGAAADAARRGIQQALHALLDGLPGVRPLSVQWMARMVAEGQVVEHFGFADGQSEARYDAPATPKAFRNQVHLGEVLIGYDNAADHARDLTGQPGERARLMRNGSYQVVRKLRQHVGALRQTVEAAERRGIPGLDRHRLLAKMMGRWPTGHADSGKPLLPVPAGDINDFNYQADPTGLLCPLAAHIRRANPRNPPVLASQNQSTLIDLPGGRPPNLVRRSLPYGPPAPVWPARGQAGASPATIDSTDRGLVFMAYNASLAEQFEVVQRWITGANSSGASSGHSDPLLGVPVAGRVRHFRFEHAGQTCSMALDGSEQLADTPQPLIALQWGAYLFAPAADALAYLRETALRAGPAPAIPWSADAGQAEIERLRQFERQAGAEAAAQAWKAALEDGDAVARYASASIWAAIRHHHHGLLRIPYGVLVADRAGVDAVLLDPLRRYSVQGYQQRLAPTIGPIYLGLDRGDDGEYQRQSAACNDAIQQISMVDGFVRARAATRAVLNQLIRNARDQAGEEGQGQWELLLDPRPLIDRVLASLCEAWFGLSEDGAHFQRGGLKWFRDMDGDNGGALYPGFFTAPSRFTFQPVPGETPERLALQHGPAVRQAMLAYLTEAYQGGSQKLQAPVTAAVLAGQPPNDLHARTLVGALMGFLPPTAGNLRRVLNEWQGDGTLWALRNQHAGALAADGATECGPLADPKTALTALSGPLARALQARPVPEQIWRTALRDHALGPAGAEIAVKANDKLILALVSATQQGLQAGEPPDVMPIFGGARLPGQASPTHACPGYRSAIGAMAGLLAGLIERAETLRPGPGAGILVFEGLLEAPLAPAPAADGLSSVRSAFYRSWQVTAPAALGQLLGWGDSWIFNHHPQTIDLGSALASLGYDTTRFEALASAGITLRAMAQSAADPSLPNSIYADIYRALVEADDPQIQRPLPKAILISGGGNDVHQRLPRPSPLMRMVRHQDDGLPLLDPAAAQAFVEGQLAQDLRKVLQNLTGLTRGRIPILVQGYDYPVPDGRNYLTLKRLAWLYPSIVTDKGHDALGTGRTLMRELIEALNLMQAQVCGEFADLRVRHLRLTGNADLPAFQGDHTRFWENELHPTRDGFQALADRVHQAILAL